MSIGDICGKCFSVGLVVLQALAMVPSKVISLLAVGLWFVVCVLCSGGVAALRSSSPVCLMCEDLSTL